jgi:hypothetical protein
MRQKVLNDLSCRMAPYRLIQTARLGRFRISLASGKGREPHPSQANHVKLPGRILQIENRLTVFFELPPVHRSKTGYGRSAAHVTHRLPTLTSKP